jgi:periplasmic protein TonB
MPSLTLRHFMVVATVLAAHAGLLGLLQAGLKNRPLQEMVIPVEMLAEWVAPAPTAAPASPPKPESPPVAPRPPAPRPAPTPAPTTPAMVEPVAPAPVPAPTPSPVPAPVPTLVPAVVESSRPATAPADAATSFAPPIASDTSVASTGPRSPAPPPTRIELPSAAARYLNNPPPRYPPLSRRLGEQGQVVLHVRIEVDGSASQAEVRTSSGYSRLDQTAVQTVLAWRYVPGTRNGVPEAMWFNIPIRFVLE